VPDQPLPRPQVHITVDGARWPVPAGSSIAAAFVASGHTGWRQTRHRAEPRGLGCGMGVCFDCLVTVNGTRGVRACLTDVREGDVITTERGSALPAWPADPRGTPGRGPNHSDVAVIGAGPAGMSAAVAAAQAGCSVTVLDLGERPGGQYWRWGPASDGRFHHGWPAFRALRDSFAGHQAAGRIVHLAGHAVFHVDPPPAGEGAGASRRFTVHAVAGERERGYAVVKVSAVVVATGAYERQLPIPGWTLPGVMAAGAAQALLKGSAVVAGQRVVVAGTGPFLLPVAVGLAQAGARVAAVVEANQPLSYLRQPLDLARSRRKLPEAAGYLARLARHRVPVLRRHAVVAAHGDGRLRAVTVARLDPTWALIPGSQRTLDADVLAVGYGFIPQVELLGEAGAQLRRGPDGPAFAAVVGADQQTSVPGLFAAGETTGIGGADLSCLEGQLAGRAAARHCGHQVRPAGPAIVRRRAALRRFGALLDAVHPVPPGWTQWLTGDTVVCRCEEVTLARLLAAFDLGADDARSVKLLARPGMGWCQGRICGASVADIVAGHRRPGRPDGGDPDFPESAVSRPLAQPVPLEVLAEAAHEQATGGMAGSPEPL
jgi:D-hydroxyproline dehydrogenase subunit alpha